VSRERWESSHRPDRAGSLVNTGDHGEVSQPLMSEDNDCPLAAREWAGAAVRSRSQRRGSGDVLPAGIERRDRGIGVLQASSSRQRRCPTPHRARSTARSH
jgi:hypothetical protein